MIKENIKVIISDLDGTLLNSDHRISDYTKQVFRELYNQNYLIIVATGRHHLDAMPIIETLGFPIYLVTSNGARIHAPNKELIFATNMESEAVKSVLEMDIPAEYTTVLFKENVWQTNKHNDKLLEFQTELNYVPELVNYKEVTDFDVIKIFFTHESHGKLIELREMILDKHPDTFSHAFSLPHCLEFMDKSVDKSVAIARILEIENYQFHQAISFGDGYNDEGMLKATSKGLLMGNAPDSLKNKLSHLEVISKNNEDGVANYLADKILNNVSLVTK
ncbi:Cof-type HAD-IIB family hydrolase [Flavobacterium sufflavum]|uniref:Cof-type HAD-IIB family hydrolase n=1 Tax=Flavobacterium sufflavum TaxID=1921138 RepID=A0A437KKH5_9FLAO|nr:Cof-type HAD-IIB family hydrolase [Flavobacterium sufflavum]RVT71219.1 Cof-type HAD-IIB family hydrolase [Flavobacterium sufflavum]